MQADRNLIKDLTTLNKIVESLNRAVDVRQALDTALARLVDLMGLETGWIFLHDPSSQTMWGGKEFTLAAHHNLPPALTPDSECAWKRNCDCQAMCMRGDLNDAYNEVHCNRLSDVTGDRRNLSVHASAPLRSGDKVMGVLNVAGADWESFSEESLALLANVGSQMGIALERARLFDLLQEQRIDEQSTLLRLSNQLLGRRDFDDLMQYLAEEARAILHADAAALLLYAEADGTLAFSAATGWKSDPVSAGVTAVVRPHQGPGLVMQTQESLVLEDIQHPDVADGIPNWLLSEGFRGHALVPLIAEGQSIGVLAIDSFQPRIFNEDELRFLRLMANQAAIAIVNARLHREEIVRQRLEEELNVARQIQQTLLPETPPSMAGWQFAACYNPARMVGGDYYDFFELPGKPSRLGMVIADVADKGIPASLFMALSRSIIRTKAMTGTKPATVMSRSNRLIYKDSRSGLFVTVFYAILSTQDGSLIYTNAGHNRPLWYHADSGQVEELETLGTVLGVFEHIRYGEREIRLMSGDTLVCYTDGVTEAMNEAEELFGCERLRDIIAAHGTDPAETLLQRILDAVEAFIGGAPQADDVTLFVVKR